MALLEIRKVSKYFGGLEALSNVDMTVNEGEIRGLIGPNGAGKTTLFNVLSGVYLPEAGDIFFERKNIVGLTPDKVAALGLVRTFQANVLFREFDVLKNVLVGCHLHAHESFWGQMLSTRATLGSEESNRREAIEIIEFLGLSQYLGERAASLPHGYQRKLGIAIALAVKPKLLMLDEPATGMNAEESMELTSLLGKIRDSGVSILLIEHNMKFVMNLCDKITVLNFGKRIAESTPAEVSKDKAVIEAYLGGGE